MCINQNVFSLKEMKKGKKEKEFPRECLCCWPNRRWGIDVLVERHSALQDCHLGYT